MLTWCVTAEDGDGSGSGSDHEEEEAHYSGDDSD